MLRDIANNAERSTSSTTNTKPSSSLCAKRSTGRPASNGKIGRFPATPTRRGRTKRNDCTPNGGNKRIARKQGIDASIAAKADYERLYDKPFVDSKRVRVAGPFTVESLSPHRALAVDEDGNAQATESPR